MFAFLSKFMRRKLVMFGVISLVLLAVLAVVVPLTSPYDASTLDITARLQPPSAAHWFGTDEFGRDIFTRVLTGGRYSLTIGVLVVVIALVVGVLMGLCAGFFKRLDAPIDAGGARAAVRGSGTRAGRVHGAHRVLPCAGQHPVADPGAGHLHLCLRDPGGSGFVLPRRRRAAGAADLGHHDFIGPGLCRAGDLAGDLPRHRHRAVGAVAANGRRRLARHA